MVPGLYGLGDVSAFPRDHFCHPSNEGFANHDLGSLRKAQGGPRDLRFCFTLLAHKQMLQLKKSSTVCVLFINFT